MDYTIDTLPSRLTLGRQTETGVNDIRIDMSEWLKQWPELVISIWPTPEERLDTLETTTDDIILMMADIIGGE